MDSLTNSYWPANSVDNILFTFTTWRSSNDWENWYNSLERKIYSQTQYSVYYQNNTFDY